MHVKGEVVMSLRVKAKCEGVAQSPVDTRYVRSIDLQRNREDEEKDRGKVGGRSRRNSEI
jgi:hypothetical protein